MRKIERLMNQAIANKQTWKLANTEVIYDEIMDVSDVYLHNHLIATISDNSIKLFDAGYQTATTKSRLNAILSQCGLPGEGIFQKNFEWFIRLWNGSEHFTTEFRNGMRLA